VIKHANTYGAGIGLPQVRTAFVPPPAPPPVVPTFRISGSVISAAYGTGFSALLEVDGLGTLYSSANGNYGFRIVSGYSGTVTPHNAAGTFDPLDSVYTQVTSDQTQNYVFYLAEDQDCPLVTFWPNIPFPGGTGTLFSLAYDAPTHTLWAGESGLASDGHAYIFSSMDGSYRAGVPLGRPVLNLVNDVKNRQMVILDSGGALTFVSTDRGTVTHSLASVTDFSARYSLAYNRNDGLAYVVDIQHDPTGVVTVDCLTGTVAGSYAIPGGDYRSAAYSDSRGELYLAKDTQGHHSFYDWSNPVTQVLTAGSVTPTGYTHFTGAAFYLPEIDKIIATQGALESPCLIENVLVLDGLNGTAIASLDAINAVACAYNSCANSICVVQELPLRRGDYRLQIYDAETYAYGTGFDITLSSAHDPLGGVAFDRRSGLLWVVDTVNKRMVTDFSPPVVVADFTGAPTSGTYPLAVTFANTSVNGLTYDWDFGDGATSTQANPAYTYTVNGAYTVTLIAHNGASSDTKARTSYITVGIPVITANFTGSPTSGTYPLAVTFANTSVNGVTYDWAFGDGGVSASVSPVYTYTAAGTNTVTLTAHNGALSDTKTRVNYVAVGTPSVAADFTGAPTSGTYPLAVAFTNTSVNGVTYAWVFGDGSTSTSASPVHTYAAAGTNTVTLVAYNGSLSGTRTRASYIAVGTPDPDFTGSPTSGTYPLTVEFIPTNILGLDYVLGFGNGTQVNLTPAGTIVPETYLTAGTYTVNLYDAPFNGQYGMFLIKSRPDYIRVDYPVVQAAFTATPLAGTIPLDVVFTNESTGALIYVWDFGDGTTGTLANPSHTYSVAGTKSVTLVAYNGAASGTAVMTDYIYPTIGELDFWGDPTIGGAPLQAYFTVLNPTCQGYLWYQDDTLISGGVYGNHVYDTVGTYPLTCIGFSGTERGTITKNNFIVVVVSAHFDPLPDHNGASPFAVTFQNSSTNATSYLWDFGDPASGTNNTSTEVTPIHTYNTPAWYKPTLTAYSGTYASFYQFLPNEWIVVW